MSADNETEKKSLMNFLYLHAAFYEFLIKSFDIYQKEIKEKSELTPEKIRQIFQDKNEDNEKSFFLQNCAIIDAQKENKNEKKKKIESFFKLNLGLKLDEDVIFEKVDEITKSYHKIFSKEKQFFNLIAEKLYNFIYKSNNLFFLIIKMIKKNERKNISNLSNKYLLEEDILEEKINKNKEEKTDLKNEINRLNQKLEKNTKELMEVKKNFDETTKKLKEVNNENILLNNQIRENKIEAEKNLKETEKKCNETEKNLKETEKNLKETAKKCNETEKNLKETEKKCNETEKNLKETEKNLKETEKNVNELKKENIFLKNQINENKIETENNFDELKKENIYLKNLIRDNKIEAENKFKLLKDLNEKILEKMGKDQKIYDTYQEKIYEASLTNSQLNNIIEIQKNLLMKQQIEIAKHNSEIERLNLKINAMNIENNINEKKNSNK